jgi:hypothetical protein
MLKILSSKDFMILQYNTVWSAEYQPTFRRYMSPPFSEFKKSLSIKAGSTQSQNVRWHSTDYTAYFPDDCSALHEHVRDLGRTSNRAGCFCSFYGDVTGSDMPSFPWCVQWVGICLEILEPTELPLSVPLFTGTVSHVCQEIPLQTIRPAFFSLRLT